MSLATALHALAEHFRRTGHHELADTLTQSAAEQQDTPAQPVDDPPPEPDAAA